MVAVKLFLYCQSCFKKEGKKHQNYFTQRVKKTPQDVKLDLKKYCPFCRQIQVHQEQILSRNTSKK